MPWNIRSKSKKFSILDEITKLELTWKALVQRPLGDTAYGIARILGCNPGTSNRLLDKLRGFDLVVKHKVGRCYAFIPKKVGKSFRIRSFLEDKFTGKDRSK